MQDRRVLSVDVGGTFTDVLEHHADGRLLSHKFPSADGAALAALFSSTKPDAAASEVRYSTTAAVNALLTGNLPRVGLIVTRGFRDILETARLPRPAEDNERDPLPPRLIALEHVYEISARMDAGGQESRALDALEIEAIVAALRAARIDVVAIALLHRYLNPAHERALATQINALAPRCRVIQSSTVLPLAREYERTLVTALNAVLVPVLGAHLDEFAAAAADVTQPAWLMQAGGGLTPASTARERPLGTALAGPAAAVVGMRALARERGYRDLITLDIGGTSTDVALIRAGEYALTSNATVAGFPVPMSMVDVLSIGAGGGSIAHAAPDQRWHVGPASAGAQPGPACYGRGGSAATLTDANLVLGRLPAALLGGAITLDVKRARASLSAFGAARGLDDMQCARGILDIASNTMCGAVRRVIALHGVDPQEFTLMAMGGAGPLHAAELASLLGIHTVVIPPQPGLAAAWGVMLAGVREEFIAPVGVTAPAFEGAHLAATTAALEQRARQWLREHGLAESAGIYTRKFDLRYAGMSHETTIECPNTAPHDAAVAATVERFHEHFAALTGRSWRDREAVEVVNVRLVVELANPAPPAKAVGQVVQVSKATKPCRAVGFLGLPAMLDSTVVRRATLAAGQRVSGPAVIEQYEATTIVPPQWCAQVAAAGELVLTQE